MTFATLRTLRLESTIVAAAALGAATGCSSLSAPFNTMKGGQMTVYRLQNYAPPAAPSGPAAGGGFQLPAQIQQWISAGASLLPPGLLPPGIVPGSTPAPAAAGAPRFPPEMGPNGFPILAYQPVTDASTQSDVLDVFGHASDFQAPTQSCMYAELGFSMTSPSNPRPQDLLVSLSCGQVQAVNFGWPYPVTGITPDTEKKLVAIAQRVFGGH